MPTTLHALIVEDSDDDCERLLRELRRGGYDPVYRRVDTPEGLNAALDGAHWDVVFGDFSMPRLCGTDALAIVRRHDREVPFIFVSGTIGEETAVASMKAGAQDYIMKSNLKRLLPALERELRDARLRHDHAQAERARREAEERFQNVLSMAADAIISVDRNQNIIIFNRGAERIFGYAADEVIGRNLHMLLPARLRGAHSNHIRGFLEGTESARRMGSSDGIVGRRKDGSEFPAEASISKVVDDNGTILTVILRDVTDRKRSEQELRLLQEIIQAAGEADDLYGALAIALEKACAGSDWSLGQIWFPRQEGRSLECGPAWYARDSGLAAFRGASQGTAFASGEGLPGNAWAQQRPIWSDDASTEEQRGAAARSAGLRAGIAIPVLADGVVIAVCEFFAREARADNGHLLRLASAIGSHFATVIQRKEAEERLRYLAHHDALTGLPNRALLGDRLEQALSEARRRGRLAAVAFLDLDRFKTINDSLGHEIGDLLLIEVGRRLKDVVRDGDTVARSSGDEFILIFADMARAADAALVAQKIVDVFARPFEVAGHQLFTSISMGLALYPDDDEQAGALLRSADIAMYRAKERGGNAYHFYTAEMTYRAQQRLALEGALRRAIDNREFVLHYQPIVDLHSNAVTAFESLIRWRHPERGLVMPGEFIGLAEETGAINQIGEWVLLQVCAEMQGSSLLAIGDGRARVSVNLSARQFQHKDLVKTIEEALAQTGFDPNRLDVELTESLLMQNTTTVLNALNRISEMGVHIAIDDFGTGYSSLGYLKRFPIDSIKIDRSFVRDITSDPDDAAIVTAIIAMGRRLGIRVVAEGVETQEQLEFLRANDCDAVQGYLLGRPMPLRPSTSR